MKKKDRTNWNKNVLPVVRERLNIFESPGINRESELNAAVKQIGKNATGVQDDDSNLSLVHHG